MEWSQEKCIQLIEVYHIHEVLWNPKHKLFYNIIKKEDAWHEIAEHLERGVEDCKKKMESLKGSYRREKCKVKKSATTGKGCEEVYQSRWFAYNAMKYLDDKNQPRNTISNVDMEEIEDEIVDLQGCNTDKNEDATDKIEEGQLPKQSPVMKPSKRKRTEDPRINEAFACLKKAVNENETLKDECSTFAQYIEQKLRKLDERNRAIAQHRINNIFFEIEMASYPNLQNPPTTEPTHSILPSNIPLSNSSHIPQTSHSSSSYIELTPVSKSNNHLQSTVQSSDSSYPSSISQNSYYSHFSDSEY